MGKKCADNEQNTMHKNCACLEKHKKYAKSDVKKTTKITKLQKLSKIIKNGTKRKKEITWGVL